MQPQSEGPVRPIYEIPIGKEVPRKLTEELRKTRGLNPHYYESRLSFQDSATNQHSPIFQVVGLTQPKAHRHSHYPFTGTLLEHRRTTCEVQHSREPSRPLISPVAGPILGAI